jgi:hypothetical protein
MGKVSLICFDIFVTYLVNRDKDVIILPFDVFVKIFCGCLPGEEVKEMQMNLNLGKNKTGREGEFSASHGGNWIKGGTLI